MERRQQQIEESIQRYLDALETADRTKPVEFQAKAERLQHKIATLRDQMRRMERIKTQLATATDGQLSTTDPDSRSMISQAKGTGVVGYNVQTAVDAKHHLVVEHEVANVGSDRAQLAKMATAARDAMGMDCSCGGIGAAPALNALSRQDALPAHFGASNVGITKTCWKPFRTGSISSSMR